jgi:hypothetical protein
MLAVMGMSTQDETFAAFRPPFAFNIINARKVMGVRHRTSVDAYPAALISYEREVSDGKKEASRNEKAD